MATKGLIKQKAKELLSIYGITFDQQSIFPFLFSKMEMLKQLSIIIQDLEYYNVSLTGWPDN